MSVCLLPACRYHHRLDYDNTQYQRPPLPPKSFLCHGHGLVHRSLLCLRLLCLDRVCSRQLLFHPAGQPGAEESSGNEDGSSGGSGCSHGSSCTRRNRWRGFLSKSETLCAFICIDKFGLSQTTAGKSFCLFSHGSTAGYVQQWDYWCSEQSFQNMHYDPVEKC